ncbi:hypothetical protein IJI31_01860 [bacterium]|nr:hypothetical protein [bacterium]
MYQANEPRMIERIIAPLSYISMGLIGFVWLILATFSKYKGVRPFLRYHIFQSIFLSIAYFLLCKLLGLLLGILSLIPFVNVLVLRINFYLNMPLIFSYSAIQILCYTVIFYLVVTSFQGKYSYLPWVSNIIDANVGQKR